MIDLDHLRAMTDEQLADELDAMVERVIEAKLKGPAEMAKICGLVPLLTARLRQSALFVTIPRLDRADSGSAPW